MSAEIPTEGQLAMMMTLDRLSEQPDEVTPGRALLEFH